MIPPSAHSPGTASRNPPSSQSRERVVAALAHRLVEGGHDQSEQAIALALQALERTCAWRGPAAEAALRDAVRREVTNARQESSTGAAGIGASSHVESPLKTPKLEPQIWPSHPEPPSSDATQPDAESAMPPAARSKRADSVPRIPKPRDGSSRSEIEPTAPRGARFTAPIAPCECCRRGTRWFLRDIPGSGGWVCERCHPPGMPPERYLWHEIEPVHKHSDTRVGLSEHAHVAAGSGSTNRLERGASVPKAEERAKGEKL